MLEVPGPASNVTGYFTSIGAPAHQPNQNWIQLNANNRWGDTATFSGYPAPWSQGGFDWDIPMKWRLVGSTTEHDFTHRLQQFRILGTDGTSSVSKLGQTVQRTP